jgi:hypothetical protein
MNIKNPNKQAINFNNFTLLMHEFHVSVFVSFGKECIFTSKLTRTKTFAVYRWAVLIQLAQMWHGLHLIVCVEMTRESWIRRRGK